MMLMLYVHTIIILGELYKAKNKPLTYLGPGNILPRHGVLLGPQTWALWEGNLYRGLMRLSILSPTTPPTGKGWGYVGICSAFAHKLWPQGWGV